MSAGSVGDPWLDLMRAVERCHPGWTSLRAITFFPRTKSGIPWSGWKEDVFSGLLRPHLEAALQAAQVGDGQKLVECDRSLDGALEPKAAATSREAGAALLTGFSVPAAEKLWMRHARQVADGDAPGHLAIGLAVRAASFHLPPATVIAAYVFLEARGGLGGAGMVPWMNMVEDCFPVGADSAPQIKVA